MKNIIYSHPNFKDVVMVVNRIFYIPEKRSYSLKVQWLRRGNKGGWLATERLTLTRAKFKEFYPCNIDGTDLKDIPGGCWADVVYLK